MLNTELVKNGCLLVCFKSNFESSLDVQQKYTYFNPITHTPTDSQFIAIKVHFSTELILHNEASTKLNVFYLCIYHSSEYVGNHHVSFSPTAITAKPPTQQFQHSDVWALLYRAICSGWAHLSILCVCNFSCWDPGFSLSYVGSLLQRRF